VPRGSDYVNNNVYGTLPRALSAISVNDQANLLVNLVNVGVDVDTNQIRP
jgi:hypothetical protein